MTSFQTKISWKRLTRGENKNYRFVSFLHDGKQKILKKQQKNSKHSKIRLRLHFLPKHVGKGRKREKIKIIVPFHPYPKRNRKQQKN